MSNIVELNQGTVFEILDDIDIALGTALTENNQSSIIVDFRDVEFADIDEVFAALRSESYNILHLPAIEQADFYKAIVSLPC